MSSSDLFVDRYAKLAARILQLAEEALKSGPLDAGKIRRAVAAAAREATPQFGRKNPALERDTVAVAILEPKTASLFFDRVWTPPFLEGAAPDEIAMYCGSDREIALILGPLYDRLAEHTDGSLRELFEATSSCLRSLEPSLINADVAMKFLADVVSDVSGMQTTPVYMSAAARDVDYKPGNDLALVTAIDGLKVVNEERLMWSQVTEFRKDPEAIRKLRRMRNWLDREMTGKSSRQVTDAISVALEDYDWSLRKHGIETINGTISDLLDPRLLSTAAATATGLTLAGGGLLGALGGAVVMVGRAAVSISQKLVDLADRKRGPGSEVAFVHEIKKLTDK